MSIFSGLFRSRDKPTNSTTGSSYRFFFGGTTSGKAVTERSAMQMTAVYSCVRILSEAIAGLPIHLYRYGEGGSKEKAINHPLYFLLHDEPNPEMTSFVFRETLMTHLLLWGNAYAQIIRNGKGEVVALYPLMPNRMTVNRDENGELYYEYQTSQDEAHTMNGSRVRLQPSDVLHVPGLGFDGLVGYSPIAMAKNAIGMAIACEEYGAKFFANGATPGGILEHPGVVKDPERVRESWNSAFGGSSNANKVAVLEEGMKYTPISISPEQAQFLETRKFQINEIARIFRIPPHMIGDLEKSSFSNIEQQSLEFVKYTLDPWVCRWEQSMQRALLSPDEKKDYFFKFNVDGLLRGDYQSRMNGYAVGRQNGWMSANDIRELENLTDLIKVSDELLSDSFFDIEGYISEEFGRAFGEAEEDAFINGAVQTGQTAIDRPTGLFIPSTAGGAPSGVTAASATAITADELISLVYSLKAPYRSKAKFLMNDATVAAIRKLKDLNGVYVWQPALTAGEPDRLLGYPLYTSPKVPTMAAGARAIAFGDFSCYWIADRAGRTIKRLNELYATNGQVGLRHRKPTTKITSHLVMTGSSLDSITTKALLAPRRTSVRSCFGSLTTARPVKWTLLSQNPSAASAGTQRTA